MKSLFRTCILLFILLCGGMLAAPESAEAVRKSPTAEEYKAQKEKLMGLLEYLRTSPYLVWPKNFTEEEENGINNGLKKYFSDSDSDYTKVLGIMSYVRKIYRGTDDAEMFLYIADYCRLKHIPCFVLEDKIQEETTDVVLTKYYKVVFYANDRWYVANPYFDNEEIYEMESGGVIDTCGIFPTEVFFYKQNELMLMPSSITIDMDIRNKYTSSAADGNHPNIAYDSETNSIKTYYRNKTVAVDEPFMTTGMRTDENGCPPSGWIDMEEVVDKTDGTSEVNHWLGYSFHGIFLKGRLERDGVEYDLQNTAITSNYPYRAWLETYEEPAEHKEFRKTYSDNLVAKTKKIANGLLADPDYIWDDVYFESAEREKLVRDAVDTALDINYIKESSTTLARLRTVGVDIDSEDPENLSDKAKAQAILGYIKRNVEPVSHGWNYVTSAQVLIDGTATCAGMSILVRDMCVVAGIPCFQLGCAQYMRAGDSLFCDHGYNMIKVGDDWMYADCMGTGLLCSPGALGYYPTSFNFDHVTGGVGVFIDFDAMQRNMYGKWDGLLFSANYFDFDENGKLALYVKDQNNKPIVQEAKGISKGTDKNGKVLMKTGLNYVDIEEYIQDEDGKRVGVVVNRYAFYYQYDHIFQGEKVINGKTYNFQMLKDPAFVTPNLAYYYTCFQKIEEVSRRYYIGFLDIRAIPSQDYTGEEVCPVPEIYHGEKKLLLHKDFELTYENNKELSDTMHSNARVKITGLGDYNSSSAVREFEIVKPDIAKKKATLSQTELLWSPDSMANRPEVSIDLDATEYSVVYKDYDTVGTASVEITGKNHHTGKIVLNYEIKQREMDDGHFILLDTNFHKPLQGQKFMYVFKPIHMNALVYYVDDKGDRHTLLSSRFEFTYSGSEECGDVTVTATAKDGEEVTGAVSATYEVTPYIALKERLKLEYTEADYDGTVKKPTIKERYYELTEGKDYTLTYERKTEDGYVEEEPVIPGEYRVAFNAFGNVMLDEETLEKDGTSCYYYSFRILESPLWTPPSPAPTASADVTPQTSQAPASTAPVSTGSQTPSGPAPAASAGTVSQTPLSPAPTASAGADAKNPGKPGASHGSTDSSAGNTSGSVSEQGQIISSYASDAVKKLKISAKKRALKIKWSKVKKAKKYFVQISLKKNFSGAKTYSVNKKKTSYTIKKLKAKKKYYVRVRAYLGKVKAGGKTLKKYGKWSKGFKKTR